MRTLLLGILAFTLIPAQTLATPTMVQGNAFYYRGKKLELHQYLDLFTFKSQVLRETDIPNDGNFRITLDVKKTGLYLIKIGKVNAHIFLVPGDEYTVVLPEPEPEDQINPGKDVFIQAEIFESKSNLNYQITDLEKRINTFIIESIESWMSGESKRSAEVLITKLNSQFARVDDDYFQRYYHFRKAELEISSGHSKKQVYQRYFEHTAPAYDQLSFANAFKLLYDDYLHPLSTRKFSDSIDHYLQNANITKVAGILNKDPMLSVPELTSLLMISELYLLGKERIYPLANITEMLQTVEMTTAIPEQKIIAVDAINLLTKLAPGTRAPDFEFSDVVGNITRLSDFQGRYIYIQFFSHFTPETLKEMSLMKVLREGYGSDIAMFSLTTEESIPKLIDAAVKYDFDWYFGKITYPDVCIENYDIRAMPTYYFLDDKLNILSSPSPPPGERIERQFARIWKTKHPNKDMPFKLQPPAIDTEAVQSPK